MAHRIFLPSGGGDISQLEQRVSNLEATDEIQNQRFVVVENHISDIETIYLPEVNQRLNNHDNWITNHDNYVHPNINTQLQNHTTTLQNHETRITALEQGEGQTKVRIRVYMNRNQTITASQATKIQFNSRLFDNLNLWDTTNYKFVCNRVGFYLIILNVDFTYNASNQINTFCIFKNGSIEQQNKIYIYLTTSNVAHTMSVISYLQVNDVIEFMAYPPGTNGLTLYGAYPYRTNAMIIEL